MNHLAPCPSCARHVRADRASICPFCGGPIAASAPRRPKKLSRAAILLGTTLSIGCGGASGEPAAQEETTVEGEVDAEASAGGELEAEPEEGAVEEGSNTEVDAPAVMYGSPPLDVLV